MRDVVVVGAGPAGSEVSRQLAERGHDVVMLEEHPAIGRPVHCTGLIGLDAFEQFDLPRRLVLSEAAAATFWGAAGCSVTVESARVRAAVIERADLDEYLAGRASRAGAELVQGYRVESVRVSPNGVTVAGRDGLPPIEARACVVACGANYRLHRTLGLGLPSHFLQSAQIDTPFPALPSIEVRFGRSVAPAGFAWMVPFARGGVSHARIGLMGESDCLQRFRSFVRTLCARVGSRAEDLPEPRLKMLPLGPVSRTFADRVIAVGDAAGLVKPTTGGGIYYGMLSAALAAPVIDEGLRRDRLGAAVLKRYEARWRRRLGQEIRVGLAFRRLAASLTDESIDALIELARVNGIVPLLQDTATFNWHRKAALALLGDPHFRRIAMKSWARSAWPI